MTAAPDMTKGLTDAEARAMAMARKEGATDRDLFAHRLAYQYLRAVAAADAANAADSAGVPDGLVEALDLIRFAHEHVNSITVQRGKLGPIATQAQTAGHALAKAEIILAAQMRQMSGAMTQSLSTRSAGREDAPAFDQERGA